MAQLNVHIDVVLFGIVSYGLLGLRTGKLIFARPCIHVEYMVMKLKLSVRMYAMVKAALLRMSFLSQPYMLIVFSMTSGSLQILKNKDQL